MAENENPNALGRKIFFLYPSAAVQNQIVHELIQEEFEVYVIKDEAKLRRALKKYPNSIVFASINEVMKEEAWEKWIRGIAGAAENAGVDIGILSSASDEGLKRKYMDQFKPRLGYTVLRSDFAPILKRIVEALDGVNAKGRRKYIRGMIEQGANATVNLPLNGAFINGLIKDISVVGFSCAFAEDPQIVKNSLFENIQIRLQTQLLKAEGIVFGSRAEGGEKSYVLLFTQRTSPDVKVRIRKYLQTSLQSKMDAELR